MPNRYQTAGEGMPGASSSADAIVGSSSVDPFQDAVPNGGEHPENHLPEGHPAIKVGVVGLCGTGFPLALTLSHHLSIIGFDSSSRRIHKLRNLVACRDTESGTGVNERNLLLTDDPEQLEKCNLIIITAPAPVKKKGGKQLDPLLAASKIVGGHLQQGAIVVYDCILTPGTTEQVLIPALEGFSSLASGTDFHVGYSPESIRKKKGQTLVKIVAGRNKEILDLIEKVYSLAFEDVYPLQSILAAEASIIMANTERSLFTALLDELAALVEYLVKEDLTGSAKRKENKKLTDYHSRKDDI